MGHAFDKSPALFGEVQLESTTYPTLRGFDAHRPLQILKNQAVPTENIIAIDWPQNQQDPVDLLPW